MFLPLGYLCPEVGKVLVNHFRGLMADTITLKVKTHDLFLQVIYQYIYHLYQCPLVPIGTADYKLMTPPKGHWMINVIYYLSTIYKVM